jgi:predicted permease
VWATINRSNRLTLRFPLLEAIGRLRAGDSVDLARARMAETMRHVTVLPSDPAQVNAIVVEPLHRTGPSTRERFGRLFGVLLVVSVVALIAACFNVANLLMSHGVGRARELAVRSAIGASATALVRQLLTEGLMLGAAAGLLATLVAGVFTRTFRDLGRIVHFQDVSITPAFDLRLLAAGVGLTVGMTLLFGVLPAILISRRGAATRLSFTAPLSQQRPFHPVIRQAVIAAQVALAVLLVSAALLYGQALQRMRDIPVGFRPDNILLMRLDPYQLTPPEGAQFYRTALATIAELPGVVAVGTSYWQPLSGVSGSLRVMTPERSEPLQTVSSLSVGFDFFKAYALPVSGRELTTDDDLASGILVNDLLAERFWPGQPATNRMLRTHGPTGGPTADRRVLGVVKMDRCNELAWDPAPCAFMPVRPYSNGGMRLSIRTEGAPVRVADQVRTALAAVDRRVLVDEVRPFTTFLDERMSREHTAVRLTVALAVLGVFLVAVGCVNLFAALIAERRSEIAVRMVLGARPLRLITDVLRRGMWLSLVGVAIAAGIGHLLYASIQEWLFEITEPSPRGLASAGIGILLITLLATSIPAYRQTRIQPTEALKEAGP